MKVIYEGYDVPEYVASRSLYNLMDLIQIRTGVKQGWTS